jgi:hypothetical protein
VDVTYDRCCVAVVLQIVPVLNPDGVVEGFYRSG